MIGHENAAPVEYDNNDTSITLLSNVISLSVPLDTTELYYDWLEDKDGDYRAHIGKRS